MTGRIPPPPGWYPQAGGQQYWDGAQWTSHFQPSPDAVRVPVDHHSALPRHRWWLWMPAYTFGLFAFVPAVHAAIQLKRRDLRQWAVGLVVADLLLWAVAGSSPSTSENLTPLQSLSAVVAIALMVAGTAHAFRVHDAVFGKQRELAPEPPSEAARDDPSVLKAHHDRRRRKESVALIARDPGLARDLKIGRPDLDGTYDDGGLVDVNHAPDTVLVSHLGLSSAQARTVVETRDGIDGFENVDDLIVMANLSPKSLDAVRDRIVAL